MNKIRCTKNYFYTAILLCFSITAHAQSVLNEPIFDDKKSVKYDFVLAPQVNVANTEELYSAVNNPANAGNQIVLAAGVYTLSVNDSSGAARPNGGRLELQENMAIRGAAGNRGAVVIDAINLPAGSYNGDVPNSGAIRTGRGTNAVEWLTVRNSGVGGAGVIVHLSAPGTAYVRIAHCILTGGHRGIDIRNIAGGATGYLIEAEIVDNDLHNNRISSATGLRIINTQGVSGNVINAYLSGNRMFANQQGLIVENIGSTNGAIVSVYSSGDRFFENGGGATIGGALGPTNNSTVNFTAVGAVFENNNGFTDFYRGGLNVAGSVSFPMPNGGSNNTANVTLRNCRFANNQVTDLAAYGASSMPVTIGPSGANNRTNVRLFGTPTANIIKADSDPANPAGMNSVLVTRPTAFDYDGDGRADLSVFRPSDQTWYINRASGEYNAVRFGLATDKFAPADYDGDGKTDIAVYRDGVWYWLNSSNNQFNAFQFGVAGDIPQPADFDGDGRAELAVVRDRWYVQNLANGLISVREVGCPVADIIKPMVGDYNGDGRADYALYCIYAGNTSEWEIQYSSGGSAYYSFGINFDIPVPADYDGDGKTDPAVFRPSTGDWYIRNSADGKTQIVNWGINSDKLVPADYDGDGKADIAIFREGVWWIRQTTGGMSVQQFGLANDKPVPAAYMP